MRTNDSESSKPKTDRSNRRSADSLAQSWRRAIRYFHHAGREGGGR